MSQFWNCASLTATWHLSKVTQEMRDKLDQKLFDKQRKDGKRSITDADKRRWELPKTNEKFEHWTIPFDTDPDWPKELQRTVTEYRKAWRAKMDEVNACIAANAAQEELVDQPEVVKGIVRVSGPFTVEAVQPTERSISALDGMFGGEPGELEEAFDVKNIDSYLDQMVHLLKLDGVRFPNNKEMLFGRLDRLVGQSGGLHAEGRWMPKGETDDDPEGKANVAVGFGPQYGPVTAKQVEDLIRTASRRGYDALVVAGFSFDGPAQAAIEEAQHPKLLIHMASIRPDINPGMAGLLKEQPGSQLFTVFGQPRTRLEGPDKRGDLLVHMEGVDIYDPVANTITQHRRFQRWRLGLWTETTTVGRSASRRHSFPTSQLGTSSPMRWVVSYQKMPLRRCPGPSPCHSQRANTSAWPSKSLTHEATKSCRSIGSVDSITHN